MTAEMQLLPRLRRSILGAWLAVFYALAVLASGLAPSPVFAGSPLDGALLCSGLTPPGHDAPEPAGEPTHCKGCPVNPVLAAPAQAPGVAVERASLPAATVDRPSHAEAPPALLGLPPSRAPPATASRLI